MTLIWIYLTLPDVAFLKQQNPSTTAFIEIRKQEAAAQGSTLRIRQKSIRLNELPEVFVRSIIVAEDASFWTHNGIDWYEVKESIRTNWNSGRFARGGSTITQQLAKNLYLSAQRSIYRKMQEWLIARQLEKQLSKSRILELYLNTIELGDGIFGIAAASQIYFGKHPGELELWEMVRLAAIIPSPLTLKPNYPSRALRWRSRVVLRRLYRFDFISESEYLWAQGRLDEFFGV